MKCAYFESYDKVQEDIFLAAEPHIKKLCASRWESLEPEDRMAEASLFFICAFYCLPRNTSHFKEDLWSG